MRRGQTLVEVPLALALGALLLGAAWGVGWEFWHGLAASTDAVPTR